MDKKSKLASYYSNAREFVKQNDPKSARAYVLAMLNSELETYKHAKTILLKAKSSAFLDQWIAVSRELYEKGITDYVLQCFGLPTKKEQMLPKLEKKSQNPEKKVAPKVNPKTEENGIPKMMRAKEETPPNGGVDLDGLIEASPKSQAENIEKADEWAAALFEKNKTSVVEILSSNGKTAKCGTGFIISKNGYLLTNDHVVFDENTQAYFSSVKMSFAGKSKKYKLEVLNSNKKWDVALCGFQPDKVENFTAIKRISDYSQVKQGNKCLVIGNPFGEGLSPFTGEIRYLKNREGNLVYCGEMNFGDSGSPVLNGSGECIGINKSKTLTINDEPVSGFSNATPMDKIDELLKEWCTNDGIKL